jgi:hypothetical protein
MMPPYNTDAVDNTIRKKIATHLVTNYQGEGTVTVWDMLTFILSEIPEWGKAKLLDADEIICTAILISKSSRNNSFVKVSQMHSLLLLILTALALVFSQS